MYNPLKSQMTLRDYFAGQIIPVLLKQASEDKGANVTANGETKYMVIYAYEIASQMLRERTN